MISFVKDARHWVCAVHGGALTVACTAVQETHEDDENGFRRRERFVGKWERRFQLPENVSTASCLHVLANDCLQCSLHACGLLAESWRSVNLPVSQCCSVSRRGGNTLACCSTCHRHPALLYSSL